MTIETIEAMERMWADGVPVKEIARAIGYTPQYVRSYACTHRDMFPRRYPNLTDRVKKEYVEKVMRGELTGRQAARELGVSRQALYYWMKGNRDDTYREGPKE